MNILPSKPTNRLTQNPKYEYRITKSKTYFLPLHSKNELTLSVYETFPVLLLEHVHCCFGFK